MSLASNPARRLLAGLAAIALAAGAYFVLVGSLTYPDDYWNIRSAKIRADAGQVLVLEADRLVLRDLPAGGVLYEWAGTVWDYGFGPADSLHFIGVERGAREFSLFVVDPSSGVLVRGPLASRAAWVAGTQRWVLAGEGRYLTSVVSRLRRCLPDFTRCDELGPAVERIDDTRLRRYAHLAVSADGRFVSVATNDQFALHRDGVRVVSAGGERFIGAAFDPEGEWLVRIASGAVRHRVSLLDLKRLEETAATAENVGNVTAWQVDFDAGRLWVAALPGRLTVYELPGLTPLDQLTLPDERTAVAIQPTADGVLVASQAGRLYRLDAGSTVERRGAIAPVPYDLRVGIGAALLAAALLAMIVLRRTASIGAYHGPLQWRWIILAVAYAALRLWTVFDAPLGSFVVILLVFDLVLTFLLPATGIVWQFGRLSYRRTTLWSATTIVVLASAFSLWLTVEIAASV